MRVTIAARAAPASADGDPQIERFGSLLNEDNSPIDPRTQRTVRVVADRVLALFCFPAIHASQSQTDVVEAANVAYTRQALRTRADGRHRKAADCVTVTDHKPRSSAASMSASARRGATKFADRRIEPRSAMSAPSVGHAAASESVK